MHEFDHIHSFLSRAYRAADPHRRASLGRSETHGLDKDLYGNLGVNLQASSGGHHPEHSVTRSLTACVPGTLVLMEMEQGRFSELRCRWFLPIFSQYLQVYHYPPAPPHLHLQRGDTDYCWWEVLQFEIQASMSSRLVLSLMTRVTWSKPSDLGASVVPL